MSGFDPLSTSLHWCSQNRKEVVEREIFGGMLEMMIINNNEYNNFIWGALTICQNWLDRGPFLESTENFSGPKRHLLNSDPL